MSGREDFIRSFPEVPDAGLREMRAPLPPPGQTVDMSRLAGQLDCCDWSGVSLIGHVERDEALGVYECDNGHRWVLLYDRASDDSQRPAEGGER